jgi:hypothetical protein
MTVTIADTTKNPIVIPTGTTTTPFSALSVTDTTVPDPETVTVSLSGYAYPLPASDIGTLSDPTGGGAFDANTHTFSETALSTGSPSAATTILNRLVYTPPPVTGGNESYAYATINVNGVTDPSNVQIETAGPPTITFTIAHEPVASGSTIPPFGAVQIAGAYIPNDTISANITVTDGGAATDADGLLAGVGLGKTGTGTYTVSAPNGYTLQGFLNKLVFTPAAVAPGATRTTAFELQLTESVTKLSADDKATSVDTIGPTPMPTPPLIAGIVDQQSVTSGGNAISPFRDITISDTNPHPIDSAKITVSGGGTLAGAHLAAGPTGTIFTIAAETPDALTKDLESLTFTPSQTSDTSTLSLAVTDGALSATATTTIIQTQPPAPKGSSHFTVIDQTTGQQTVSNGEPYTGPVAGLDWQLIDVTPDKLNITASVPNAFIHTGSGDDAIDVSGVDGTNVLDGSTGSNFLSGGTGHDTFYVDDRAATQDIWSTVHGFHAGDDATVWGLTPNDFTITKADNVLPTSPGLDFAITAAGKPNANLTLTGYSTADLTNGRLSVTFGHTPDLSNLPGSDYMLIHANA